jgi:hypothetical protein
LSKVVLLLCNADVLARVKETLFQELETRFLAHGVMDALGIVDNFLKTPYCNQNSFLLQQNTFVGWGGNLCARGPQCQ